MRTRVSRLVRREYVWLVQAIGAVTVLFGSAFDWMIIHEQGVSGLEWGYGILTALASVLGIGALFLARLLAERGHGGTSLCTRWGVWVLALVNLCGIGAALLRMPLLAGSLLVGDLGVPVQVRTWDLLGPGMWMSLSGALVLWFMATWNLPGKVVRG